MLSYHFSKEEFNDLPTSTNAVESHNQLSKNNQPEILGLALLTTYKVDMASVLEHMASSEGLLTDYSERNDEYRLKNSSTVKKSRAKRKQQIEDDCQTNKDIFVKVTVYLSCVFTCIYIFLFVSRQQKAKEK